MCSININPRPEVQMRPKLHAMALQRFAFGMVLALGVPLVAMAWRASPVAVAFAFAVGTLVALAGTQQLARRRRRALQPLSVLMRQGGRNASS
jgi:hypothetical protein